MPVVAAPPATRGRHRSAAADEAILSATLDLLRQCGYGGLTVAAVIERSGVSSATLYRRWPAKQDLVAAALESLSPEPENTDTGSLAGDIQAFVRNLAASVAARREEVVDAIASEAKRNPELGAALREKFLVPRLEQLTGILRRATRRHEVGQQVPPEVALSLIAGPLYYQAFVLSQPVTPAFQRRCVVHALHGLGAGPGS